MYHLHIHANHLVLISSKISISGLEFTMPLKKSIEIYLQHQGKIVNLIFFPIYKYLLIFNIILYICILYFNYINVNKCN